MRNLNKEKQTPTRILQNGDIIIVNVSSIPAISIPMQAVLIGMTTNHITCLPITKNSSLGNISPILKFNNDYIDIFSPMTLPINAIIGYYFATNKFVYKSIVELMVQHFNNTMLKTSPALIVKDFSGEDTVVTESTCTSDADIQHGYNNDYTESPDQDKFNKYLDMYNARTISLSKAAVILGIEKGDLYRKFQEANDAVIDSAIVEEPVEDPAEAIKAKAAPKNTTVRRRNMSIGMISNLPVEEMEWIIKSPIGVVADKYGRSASWVSSTKSSIKKLLNLPIRSRKTSERTKGIKTSADAPELDEVLSSISPDDYLSTAKLSIDTLSKKFNLPHVAAVGLKKELRKRLRVDKFDRYCKNKGLCPELDQWADEMFAKIHDIRVGLSESDKLLIVETDIEKVGYAYDLGLEEFKFLRNMCRRDLYPSDSLRLLTKKDFDNIANMSYEDAYKEYLICRATKMIVDVWYNSHDLSCCTTPEEVIYYMDNVTLQYMNYSTVRHSIVISHNISKEMLLKAQDCVGDTGIDGKLVLLAALMQNIDVMRTLVKILTNTKELTDLQCIKELFISLNAAGRIEYNKFVKELSIEGGKLNLLVQKICSMAISDYENGNWVPSTNTSPSYPVYVTK